ncbi:MAG: hypothetical protein ACRDH5_11765 [bacterium]
MLTARRRERRRPAEQGFRLRYHSPFALRGLAMHVQRVEYTDKRRTCAMLPGRFAARRRGCQGRFESVHGAENFLVIARSLRCCFFGYRVCA